jgi:diketogulonate reductase-like aldo/keto reductase
MRFESGGGVSLPKVGFGTWSLGGGSSAEPSKDVVSLAALRSALELGYTHFDTAEMYAAGHCEELLGSAIRESGRDRATLFITSKVLPEHLAYQEILDACERSLRRLLCGFIDLYLIHWPAPRMRLAETFRALNHLVREGKVRHLGVSNFDVRLLEQAQQESATSIVTNQVPYSLSDRSYVENGVLGYCQRNGILLTAYSPLDVGKLRVGPDLAAIASARGATPQQIALAWLCTQPGVITIPMSLDARHQKQNLAAADILLTEAEVARLA